MTPDKLQTDLKIARLIYPDAAERDDLNMIEIGNRTGKFFYPLAPAVTVALMEVKKIDVEWMYDEGWMAEIYDEVLEPYNVDVHKGFGETIPLAVYNCVAKMVTTTKGELQ